MIQDKRIIYLIVTEAIFGLNIFLFTKRTAYNISMIIK